ncbi:hypothetical protein [Tissierella praeacuta]|nr:hypothetical protein [Tissierella praeacuta]
MKIDYLMEFTYRILFVRRYWYGDSIKELAIRIGTTPNKLASHMFRLRLNLKDVL